MIYTVLFMTQFYEKTNSELQICYDFFSTKQNKFDESSGNALGIQICRCRCRCILESSGSQNSGCTQYQRLQNQRVQKVMSQRSAGLCTRCTRSNAFPALDCKKVGKYEVKMLTNKKRSSENISTCCEMSKYVVINFFLPNELTVVYYPL